MGAVYDDAPTGNYSVGENGVFLLIRKSESGMSINIQDVYYLFQFMQNQPPIPNPMRPSTFLKRPQVTFSNVEYNFGQKTKTFPIDDSNPNLVRQGIQFANSILTKKGYPELNGCHISMYPDGTAGVDPHQDDEPVIDQCVPIVSFSFGATRRFSFYRRQTTDERLHQIEKSKAKNPPAPKPVKIASVMLRDGDIGVMINLQKGEILHGIDKDAKIKTPRLNLTFRKFLKL
jgi:hypothetical protein